MIKIEVIIGSTREGRFGDKPAKWIFDMLSKKERVEAELIDLRDWPLPFFNEAVSPSMNQGKYANELAAKWAEKVGEADGYIIVTPEYNHGYSAVLKNAIDYVYNEWNNKPVAFVGYGSMGGARAIEQLREVAVELQMTPIRSAVHIPGFWNYLDENSNLKTGSFDKAAEGMIDQLIWWAQALKSARSAK